MRLMACEVTSLYLLSITYSIECIESTSNSTRALALELGLRFFKKISSIGLLFWFIESGRCI